MMEKLLWAASLLSIGFFVGMGLPSLKLFMGNDSKPNSGFTGKSDKQGTKNGLKETDHEQA